MHFTSGASVASVEANWLTAMTAAWSTIANPLKALYPAGTVLEQTKTEALTIVALPGPPARSGLRAAGVSEDNPAIAGTSANPALPDQNAILVSLRGALPGKENRGRIHLPAPDQTLVTAGQLSSTTAGHVTTAIDGVLTSMAAAGNAPVVVTYTASLTGRAVGTTSAITFAETDEVIRTVRARAKRRKAVYV
jgi:hypothetical protein